ncbi:MULTISPECIES: lasso RiPP family leader peptide-containing protein [unclassified Amycolatopsis]|nr:MULTISPECIES: lasso RiPP family leader peptide-containing protein [unclassified Amycolatopsis]MCG3754334.1 lasso RiPP family leader peptide-containing protein [Amycolatopsis sp. Poz14]
MDQRIQSEAENLPIDYERPAMTPVGEFGELTNGIGSNTWDVAWLWD